MPPRRSIIKPTPLLKAAATPLPPGRGGASRTKSVNKDASPTTGIVKAEPMSSDELFKSKSGGKGSLKFKHVQSDVEEAEGKTQNDVKGRMKKTALVKVDKIGGRRRSPPRPRRVTRKKEPVEECEPIESFDTSDDERLNHNESPPDEGYASLDASEDYPEVVEGAYPSYKAWEADDDEVDEKGDLRDFIVGEDEEYGEEDKEENMEVDEDADGDISDFPDKISDLPRGRSKKRAKADGSSADEDPAPRKRRTTIQPTEIRSLGATARIELALREKAGSKKTKSVLVQPTHAPDFELQPGSQINYHSHKADQEQSDAEDSDMDNEEGEMAEDEAENVENKRVDKDPGELGCEVTDLEKQTGMLIGTYRGTPILRQCKFQFTNQPVYGSLGIISDGEQFHADISAGRLMSMFCVHTIPSSSITKPARDHPSHLTLKPFSSGHMFALFNAPEGEFADCIFDGYITRSELVEGRQYRSSRGTLQVKELEIVLLAQDGERAFACLCMASGGKNFTLPVTEDGGITFSTKHTVVDEEGNGQEKKKLRREFLTKPAHKALPRSIVHPDIVRRPREGTDTVPVFNCTKRFRRGPKAEPQPRFVPEETLTQRAKVDPLWTAEIPQGSLVTVHSTISVYFNKTIKNKTLSFNLSAVQILAVPKHG